MSLYSDIIKKKEYIAVVGMGYVGLPIAIAFAKKTNVIGFDINNEKIRLYQNGCDQTRELGDEVIRNSNIVFTSDENDLGKAKFIIIAVPTPVNCNHIPDLSSVIYASEIVARNMVPGTIIVYESTVYPGCTEDKCIPILEAKSGLKYGIDFKVGYSPERINPGDKSHPLESIVKIVSGMDKDSLDEIDKIYSLVIEAGTYRVSNIKTAEAIKIAENSQRDINIAFMNELAIVFDKMGIDTNEVVDGMNTKWNALGFRPGLVGGHCIGVDPYYFIYEAERLGEHSQLILSGRKINDCMGDYVADIAVRKIVAAEKTLINIKIAILGITFKENCSDIRNSKVVDVYKKLERYGIKPVVCDPNAEFEATLEEYGIELTKLNEVKNMNCIIIAVAHDVFKNISLDSLKKLYCCCEDNEKILLDIKGIYSLEELEKSGLKYWRL